MCCSWYAQVVPQVASHARRPEFEPRACPINILHMDLPDIDYDYDYIMAPQRGRPYGANLGSMGRNTGTWSIRSECLSNITSWSRRKGIENTTLPFIPE